MVIELLVQSTRPKEKKKAKYTRGAVKIGKAPGLFAPESLHVANGFLR